MHLPRGCSISWETPPRLGRPKQVRLFAVWEFRDNLASAIRKACSGLSQLASVVIYGPIAVAPHPFTELKCATSSAFQSPGEGDFSTPAPSPAATHITPRTGLSRKQCFPERTWTVDTFSGAFRRTSGRFTCGRFYSKN